MNPKTFATVLTMSALVSVTAFAAQDTQGGMQGQTNDQAQVQPWMNGNGMNGNGLAAIEYNSEVVREVQQALNDAGHDAGPVDGIMGPLTRSGIESFQEEEGLDVSGQLDAETLAALELDESVEIAVFETSSDIVSSVQQRLNEEGYDSGPVDGIMGPMTRDAITRFQQSEGLDTTGELDHDTISALDIDPPAEFAPFFEEIEEVDEVETPDEPTAEPRPEQDEFFQDPPFNDRLNDQR